MTLYTDLSPTSTAAPVGPATSQDLVLRAPQTQDAAAIHQLIAECPPLDLNSVYVYLLLCQHFRHTCVLAERAGHVDGFISAYFLPDQPEVLFVWQVAVHQRARGQRLGQTMLEHLKQRLDGCALRFLETTVSPDNLASRGLFNAMARRWQAPLQEQEFFQSTLFGRQAHDAEPLLRIGPLGAA
ncbi:MAG TPA: diaminobutyrate acetyltransferase [Alcaligenes sp.]|nr:diaminobutyrate acetyltransferase [Alcaligenes sp.]HRL27439.1 diaminobutyrate acetyltransferase [Alcaligenes sp.]